jgi:hypothetical protein
VTDGTSDNQHRKLTREEAVGLVGTHSFSPLGCCCCSRPEQFLIFVIHGSDTSV